MVEQAIVIDTETLDLVPVEVRAVFASPMLSKKERISMLVNWFMKNWYRWVQQPAALPVNPTMSIASFANALTKSLSTYNIRINGQRVWTWISKRNLPREDNFHVMANIATGWQREFAILVLSILASEEPNKAITSLDL